MTYRATADWDLQFTDTEALADFADRLAGGMSDPTADSHARVLACLGSVATIQDFGFDDGPGLHLTGWTGGVLDVPRCEAVMDALAGRATGTIDWSDEEGVHWRDRLTSEGRWEQYPGIVVYPDSEATDPYIVLEQGRVTNDPTLPVLDLDPLTRYSADHPGATHLVAALRTAAESCGASHIAQQCDQWLAGAGSPSDQAGGVWPRGLVAVPAAGAPVPASQPTGSRSRSASLS